VVARPFQGACAQECPAEVTPPSSGFSVSLEILAPLKILSPVISSRWLPLLFQWG
jgi:hypothetical protein